MRPIIGVNGDWSTHCLWPCGDVCHPPPSSIPTCPQEPWEAQEKARRDRSRVTFRSFCGRPMRYGVWLWRMGTVVPRLKPAQVPSEGTASSDESFANAVLRMKSGKAYVHSTQHQYKPKRDDTLPLVRHDSLSLANRRLTRRAPRTREVETLYRQGPGI